jgi:hypothetical protein
LKDRGKEKARGGGNPIHGLGKVLAPRVGLTTNVSSATHPGHPEITEDESGRYEAASGCKSSSTNRSRAAGPEIWFRIVHAVLHGQNHPPLATYREQKVEIALGPIRIIEDGQVGNLTRQIEADQVVSVVPLTRCNLNPLMGPKTPRVTELLRKAIEWRHQLDAGEVRNRAEISRREGITRARVTQILRLMRLHPEIRENILSTPDAAHRRPITERGLRPLGSIADYRNQIREFHKLFV